MSVSKRLRFEVRRRDNFTCRYCGAKAPDVPLTVDHVVPVALGGADEPENLVTACRDCNAGKSSSSPDAPIVAGVADDALRWAAAIKLAVQIKEDEREYREAYVDRFKEEWDLWRHGPEDDREQFPLPPDWRTSLRRFHDVGLEYWAMAEAIEIALGRGVKAEKAFRYFCGTCWRMIEERHAMARDMLDNEAK